MPPASSLTRRTLHRVIGVAWAPFNDKTIVRAGFGTFFTGTDGSSFDNSGPESPNIGIYSASI